MTYYEVLEIDSRASTAEVERAFRRMARKVHPDLNAGDRAKAEAHMKLLNEIRDTLTDPLLRAGYDERLRLEAFRRESTVPPRAATPRPSPVPEEPVHAHAPPVVDDAPSAPVASPPRSSSLWVGAFLAAMGMGVLVVALLSSPKPSEDPPEPLALAASPGDAGAGVATETEPLLTAPVAPHAAEAPSEAPEAPRARRARGRGVVIHIGSTADDVLRVLGAPDRYEPGATPGESVLHYGALRLEMKNGRVVGGDAAAR
jgi:hypothetical protein